MSGPIGSRSGKARWRRWSRIASCRKRPFARSTAGLHRRSCSAVPRRRRMRPDAPAPFRRRGPRPLLLHLASGSERPSSPAGLDEELLAGIAAYRRHPYFRDLPDPPAVWSEGETRLLDYGGSGPPVLFVPSLINRAYVLDLMRNRSM